MSDFGECVLSVRERCQKIMRIFSPITGLYDMNDLVCVINYLSLSLTVDTLDDVLLNIDSILDEINEQIQQVVHKHLTIDTNPFEFLRTCDVNNYEYTVFIQFARLYYSLLAIADEENTLIFK